jgi:class 3 adenylate cyclase
VAARLGDPYSLQPGGVRSRRVSRTRTRSSKASPLTVADLRRKHGLELAVRVGINSGEVVTGTIGDRYEGLHTANGYTVALAKRIEALALPGRIYLSENTAALVASAVQLRNLGAFEMKGAQRRVEVFELEGVPVVVGDWARGRA